MLLVQQAPGEVVDWSDGAEGHGVVPPPQQVGSEHHGQVAVGHLVDFAAGRYLQGQSSRPLVGESMEGETVGRRDSEALPVPGRR